MLRFARERPVYYIEEPWPEPVTGQPRLDLYPHRDCAMTVVTPRLPAPLSCRAEPDILSALFEDLLTDHRITQYDCWYYTPLLLPASRGLRPRLVAYDCMDELQNFFEAPPELKTLEAELLVRADVVFAGGRSLFRAKRARRPDTHLVRSGVDRAHFAQSRLPGPCPADQTAILPPRLGYFGVIDERLDFDLIAGLADARPDWSIVMLGPIVKIDPETAPRRANLHYLGLRGYMDLPRYIQGWDVALMPFARNAATRYISPTKTLEYLAAGRPVISTPVPDVVADFADIEGVIIAEGVPAFASAIEKGLALAAGRNQAWLAAADALLAVRSWDQIHERMSRVLAAAAARLGVVS
jgi:UDP-galactopyranose mutase